MKTRVALLTEENLSDAPERDAHPRSCQYCLYWEHPELLVDPETESRAQVFEQKLAWLRRARAENPSGPVEFYLAHGFRVRRDDPQFPLLQLALRQD